MKSIKVIKHKQAEATNETTVVDKKPAEASTGKLVHTVKSWIAESKERRRNLPRSLPVLSVLILMAFAVAMGQSRAPAPPASPIKVTIATTNGFLGPPANRYKVGEQIPVTITMTNTSKEPVLLGPMVDSNTINFEVVP